MTQQDLSERDVIRGRIAECIKSWLDDADIVGGRSEALRIAEGICREFGCTTPQLYAGIREALIVGTITQAEADAMFGEPVDGTATS